MRHVVSILGHQELIRRGRQDRGYGLRFSESDGGAPVNKARTSEIQRSGDLKEGHTPFLQML